jgi:hypothetical protein
MATRSSELDPPAPGLGARLGDDLRVAVPLFVRPFSAWGLPARRSWKWSLTK